MSNLSDDLQEQIEWFRAKAKIYDNLDDGENDYNFKLQSQRVIEQIIRLKVKYEYKDKYDFYGYGSGVQIVQELAEKYHRSTTTIRKWIDH